MLAVNEHIFGSFRETLCVTLALAIHVPLYFWQARPATGLLVDPIAEIDFSVEEEIPEKPVPPPVQETKEEKSFMKRVKEAVGLSTPKPMPKLIIADKPKTELVGASSANQIQSPSRVAEAIQRDAKLVNKERGIASSFDVGKIETKSGGLAGVGLGAGEKVGGGGTIKNKSSAFKIARGDLPFAVQKGGDGLTSSDGDAPQIALANKTDKRIKTVSTAFFGTGGGTGGGDGSGSGGGGNLKDKEGARGLVGVSGGFSPIGAPGTDPVASRGGLVGTPGGGGRGTAGAGSAKVPYEISGDLSGRAILFKVMPIFPDWAREKGIFATVILDFYVRHTGEVNANKTSVYRSCGYSKIDALAQEALDQWRFEELDPSKKGNEQNGKITFRFKAL